MTARPDAVATLAAWSRAADIEPGTDAFALFVILSVADRGTFVAGHPDCGPDRKRQVGAGAGARRQARRGHRQRRFNAGLSRFARDHRTADAGPGSARTACSVRVRGCGG